MTGSVPRSGIGAIAAFLLIVCCSTTTAQVSMSLAQPTERAVFQRDHANQAAIAIAGGYEGTAARIEARAVPMAGFSGITTSWQVIDAAPGGGSFSSFLTLPAGWYRIETRVIDAGGSTAFAGVDRVGVGEVFVTAGQSNSANFGSPRQSPADDRISALTGSLAWQRADDPQPQAGGTGGSPWPAFGDALAAALEVPIGIVALGVGSTRVGDWQPGGANYAKLQTTLTALGPDGIRGVLWHQGESDSIAGTSAAAYQSSLEAIITQSRIDAGFDVPWGVALASYHPSATAANEALVIQGQAATIAADPLVFQGAATDSFHTLGYLSDTVHFNQQGLDAHAGQWADAVTGYFAFPVPEPGSLGLVGVVVAAAAGVIRRTRRRPRPDSVSLRAAARGRRSRV